MVIKDPQATTAGGSFVENARFRGANYFRGGLFMTCVKASLIFCRESSSKEIAIG